MKTATLDIPGDIQDESIFDMGFLHQLLGTGEIYPWPLKITLQNFSKAFFSSSL